MVALLEKTQEQGGYLCMTLESSGCSSTSHVTEYVRKRGGFKEKSITKNPTED